MIDKSRSRKQGGAGLGLALCSQIARLHGGILDIQSVPGEGSRIGMRIAVAGFEEIPDCNRTGGKT